MELRSSNYQAVQISEHVYWVGAVDWGIRDFHGYATPRGSSYNAYLVLGDTVTLVDTVKAPFFDEMMARIASVVDPSQVTCHVANHAEMDHSGSLPQALAVLPLARVYSSSQGVGALGAHFHLDREIIPLKDGETLDLGGVHLSFVEARMLHWPDNMATYVAEDRLLLSSDAFGLHLASGERFADELPAWIVESEAAKYFANILLPFSPLITRILEKVQGLGVPIDVIAPSHGPVWRDPARIVGLYGTWAAGGLTNKAVVAYDTMWGSTEKMALAVAQGLLAGGASVKVMPLKSSHRSEIAAELLDASALVLGSPTLNNNLFPTLGDLLVYLKGLKPRGLVGGAFGSYGWSGEAPKQLAEALSAMKVEVIGGPVSGKYVPDQESLHQCAELGRQVAARITERSGAARP